MVNDLLKQCNRNLQISIIDMYVNKKQLQE